MGALESPSSLPDNRHLHFETRLKRSFVVTNSEWQFKLKDPNLSRVGLSPEQRTALVE